jgi:hypothetical protein
MHYPTAHVQAPAVENGDGMRRTRPLDQHVLTARSLEELDCARERQHISGGRTGEVAQPGELAVGRSTKSHGRNDDRVHRPARQPADCSCERRVRPGG